MKLKSLVLFLIIIICLSLSFLSLAKKKKYQLKLHQQEKANIIKAVNSGTTLYSLKKRTRIYDLLTNSYFYTQAPMIVSVFNEPTLSGHRYISTHNKVRLIIDPKFLIHANNDLKMRPTLKEFSRPTKNQPTLYIGAPHENSVD